MEDYNEKVNNGTKEEPILRDRLHITKSEYGFNLFDRKEKKNLLFSKSKETCEVGKNLLLTVDFQYFEAFKEKVKDEEVITNKVLLVKTKHSDDYYAIPTLNDLYKAALSILSDRFEAGYFYKSEIPTNTLDYTYEDIEKMPESFRKEAKSKLDEVCNMIERCIKECEEVNMIEKALREKNGLLAWSIIKNRNGYEYEEIEIINPITL